MNMKRTLRRILLATVAVMMAVALSGCPRQVGDTATFAGIEFVWCPAGTFMMGRYPGELDSEDWEDPQHEVTISRGFWMSKYEVTQAQWKALHGGENPSFFQAEVSGNTDNRPVESATWDEIQSYITTLNRMNPRMHFRLPTEAEWEYACRAGTTTRFYWGDDLSYTDIGDYAWYEDISGGETHDVGGKLPNAWGLYDMSGNVYEWVQDLYGDYPDGPVTDPAGPATGAYRVFRGGAWNAYSFRGRSAARSNDRPATGIALGCFGFRLVQSDIP
jgi:formylglycine-generating enzyme required for sulfatase activity